MNPGMKMMLVSRTRENGRRGGENRMEQGGRSEMRGNNGGWNRYEGGRSDMGGNESMNYGEEMRRGGSRGEQRYEGGIESRMKSEGMEGPMEEMRRGRKRYRDGRFAPQSRYYPPPIYDEDDGMEEMARGYDLEPMNNYPEQRRRGAMENRIGFRMGDDPHTGETLTFPMQHKMHKGKGERLDKETAEEWVENMKNEDGTKGPHWTMEQTEQVRRQKGLDHDPVEFWVAMNAAYSDLCKVAKKYNVNTVDYYVDYVKAFWFNDQDAEPNKLTAYYEGVVKK